MEKRYLITTQKRGYVITQEEFKKVDNTFSLHTPTAVNFISEGKNVTLFVRHIISIEEWDFKDEFINC